jgi:cell division septum initiation protein DivIVA
MSDEGGHAPDPGGDVEQILHQLLDVVSNARPMPLSASVMINRDEVLEIIEAALTRLPEELRAARWLLREREEFLAKVQREGDDILDAARGRAERMVQRAEVVRAAQHTARRLVEEAEAESRRLRHEAEDYCDHKLAQFEIVLDRTIKTVQAGRARLRQLPMGGEEPQAEPRYDEHAPQELYDAEEE